MICLSSPPSQLQRIIINCFPPLFFFNFFFVTHCLAIMTTIPIVHQIGGLVKGIDYFVRLRSINLVGTGAFVTPTPSFAKPAGFLIVFISFCDKIKRKLFTTLKYESLPICNKKKNYKNQLKNNFLFSLFFFFSHLNLKQKKPLFLFTLRLACCSQFVFSVSTF